MVEALKSVINTFLNNVVGCDTLTLYYNESVILDISISEILAYLLPFLLVVSLCLLVFKLIKIFIG